jgi:hypothetical protein
VPAVVRSPGAAIPSCHSAARRALRRAVSSPPMSASASHAPAQASVYSDARPAPAREASSPSDANGPPASRAATSASASSVRTPST